MDNDLAAAIKRVTAFIQAHPPDCVIVPPHPSTVHITVHDLALLLEAARKSS